MNTSIHKVAYSSVALGVSLVLGPLFLLRDRGRRRIADRYGDWNLPTGSYTWFHGASMGEINGLIPIIRTWKEGHENKKTLLTATSITGLERGGNITNSSRLLPFDSSFWIKRAIKNIQVERFIFGETEIWPSLLQILANRGVKIFMVNARIEERSMSLYEGVFGKVIRDSLQFVSHFCVSNDSTRERLIRLGISASKITTTGNAKYDIPKISLSSSEISDFKKKLFKLERPTIVFASVRTGEEEILFDAIKRVEGINVIVAPRHAEKFPYFKAALERTGIKHHSWNQQEDPDTNVCLMDAYGVLPRCFLVSQGAFIGGTLKPYGGHNPLEAAGLPIAIGPHVEHIKEIVNELEEAQGLVRVSNSTEVAAFLSRVRDGELTKLGAGTEKIASKMRGASHKILNVIDA